MKKAEKSSKTNKTTKNKKTTKKTNSKKSIKFKMPIGDWSQDGHNRFDEFVFSSNVSLAKLQKAYKDSCKLTGLQFNHNQDYSGKKHPHGSPYLIWVHYESRRISPEAQEILKNHGIVVKPDESDEDYGEGYSPAEAAELILEFIKLSLPSFKYKEASFKKSELSQIPSLNGWWGELNVQFGYGLFD